MTRRAVWLPALAWIVLTGAAMAQAPPVVSHAWARATPAMAQSAAVYLTVRSASADQVTGFSTPAAAAATLHSSRAVNGVMQMRPVDSLPVAPGQDVTLAPGNYHVMLTGLKRPLAPGDHFPLTVTFAHAAPVTTDVTVERPGAASAMGGMDMPAHAHP